ncbi:Candidapepsin [Trichoderma lentiforme]|uniref:Candidapepsin n=1 Tax=Trichoderma lentiforme TaxID=1567552 RepID=A0A9P4X4F7_9HYPO|nr:Candidapepsin [Trichoderma lentiforme]
MHVPLASLSFASLAAASLPEGVIEIPLQRIKNQSAYGAEFLVGNPPQKAIIQADTGSPTYAFESPRNVVCQNGFCSSYGTYDNTTSTTTKWISDGYNDLLIDHGFGSYINDTLHVGGITVKDMMFGVVELNAASFPINTQQTAIFGLGAFCQTKACDTYPTFINQLYEHGVISRRAFSVYLGPNDADAKASLLIGGIDLAKRQGPVYKLDVLDPTTIAANEQPNWIPLSSLELQLANGTKVTSTYDNGTYALWDTGSPGWYVQQDLFDALTSYWGLANPDPNDTLFVDCKFREPSDDSIAVNLGQGIVFNVPLSSLPIDNGDGTCTAPVAPFGTLMGDTFLRNVYFTFDYDNLTIEFSLAKYTDETNIVKIE